MTSTGEPLQFEWDEDKAEANWRKHRVEFSKAIRIFNQETFEFVDDREDYGETRVVAYGRVDFEVYRVVFTRRGGRQIRIISAWKASKIDREKYYRQLYP